MKATFSAFSAETLKHYPHPIQKTSGSHRCGDLLCDRGLPSLCPHAPDVEELLELVGGDPGLEAEQPASGATCSWQADLSRGWGNPEDGEPSANSNGFLDKDERAV